MKNGGERVTFRVSSILDLPDDYASGCDLTYSDPPWEQPLVNMFETLAQRDGGVAMRGASIDALIYRLFELSPAGVPVFVEYSTKGHTRVRAIGNALGFSCTYVHNCIQTNGKPYVIVQFNSDMPPMDGASGWEPLERVLAYHKPRQVFEPFAGHGQHARRMVKAGCRVTAAELNPARALKLQEYFGL